MERTEPTLPSHLQPSNNFIRLSLGFLFLSHPFQHLCELLPQAAVLCDAADRVRVNDFAPNTMGQPKAKVFLPLYPSTPGVSMSGVYSFKRQISDDTLRGSWKVDNLLYVRLAPTVLGGICLYTILTNNQPRARIPYHNYRLQWIKVPKGARQT